MFAFGGTFSAAGRTTSGFGFGFSFSATGCLGFGDGKGAGVLDRCEGAFRSVRNFRQCLIGLNITINVIT